MDKSKIIDKNGDWENYYAGIVVQTYNSNQDGIILDLDSNMWTFCDHNEIDSYNGLACYVMFQYEEEGIAINIVGSIQCDNFRSKEDALDIIFKDNVGRFIACVYASSDDDDSCIHINIYKNLKTGHYITDEYKTDIYGEPHNSCTTLIDIDDVSEKPITKLIDELRDILKDYGKVDWNLNTRI